MGLGRGIGRTLSVVLAVLALSGLAAMPASAHQVTVAGVPPGQDFNGDGKDDLAIGIPGATVSGHAGAGAVEVLYGSSVGLRSNGSQLWTLDSTGIPDTSAKGDKFGWAVASGDFNRDGFDDLAIGAPGRVYTNGANHYRNSGAVYILFGSPSGLRPHSGHVKLPGRCPRCEYGYALATGDVLTSTGFHGGDLYPDLIIGAPGANQIDIDSGRRLSGLGGVTEQGINPLILVGSRFGASVAVGKFFSLVDSAVAVGAPLDEALLDSTQQAEAGKVYVFQHVGAPVLLQQDSFGGNPAEAGDHFGASMTAADLNGDGYDDLVVGVPGEDLSNLLDSGAVQVILAQGGGGFGASPAPYTLTLDSPNVPGDRAPGDQFGAAVATGHVSNNLIHDIIVGAPGKRVGGHSGAGAVAVVINAGDGTPSLGGSQLWTQDSSGVLGSAQAGDRFGASLSVGQFGNGAGVDLAIGVPYEDVNGHMDAGAVAVLYGTGMAISKVGNQLWTRDSAGIAGATHANDHFGSGLP